MTIITATDITKTYGPRRILRNVSAAARGGDCLGIIGQNGSGKSTFVRIVAGVLRPTSGTVSFELDGRSITDESRPMHSGFVAPYLRLYDEFTAVELLDLHARLHGRIVDSTRTHETLERLELSERCTDRIQTLSSGQRQRVAMALAVHLEPPLLILDEPSITMDNRGRELVEHEIRRHRERGGIVILATNDDREKELCTHHVSIDVPVSP
ncbi:MAG: ABC transporter ATP-binding protein ['Candidatus Kapabacteria' thiocyanatum]|uniref:ABC transporter domain-containing protein n=1 Tax=Candidatus Kapaibacterium thiocyanatum TaxID=1895771 RepID=A0A1M3KX24_9BACT|nr:ABC transporter ATP-binding protein ['Candidatus Kapabacteria' thiocyanatum]OJX56968.1 MAG: hypothetical protein BGO89_10630 ['Candidatus Kapabacteria' thiocyanatum]